MRKFLTIMMATVFLSLPCFAGSWFIELDGWNAEPDNSFPVASYWDDRDSSSDSLMGGDVMALDFEDEITLQFLIGFESDGYGTFSLSYWSYDEDDDLWLRGDYDEEEIGFLLGHPDDSDGPGDFVSAMGNTNAGVIDFTWGNGITDGSGKFNTSYNVGLRKFDYEQSLFVNYREYYSDSGTDEFVWMSTNIDGWGFTAGLDASFDFNEYFGIYSGVGFAYLPFTDKDYDYRYEFDDDDSLARHNIDYDDEMTTQLEFDIKAHINIWRGLFANIGYKYMNWVDVNTYGMFPDDVLEDVFIEMERDVNWSGWYVGVGYKHTFEN